MRALPFLLVVTLPLAGQQLRLADLEQMALAANPSLAQAEARVRAAAGRVRQDSAYPNPLAGATGSDISRGEVFRGGEWGGFVEQRIVTAGKLGLARRAAEQNQRVSEQGRETERLRVLIEIRQLYYRALTAQRLVEIRQEMADVTARTASTAGELQNIGQADQPDRLSAEIEAERALLNVTLARNAQEQVWREIAAFVNQPGLGPRPLEGDLEMVPMVAADVALARILSESPAVRASEALVVRNGVLVQRARIENVPDITLRGGLHYNRELLENAGGRVVPAGVQGSFQASVQLPIFNRNQGAIAAAEAEAALAGREADRVRLALQQKFAGEFRHYQDSIAALTRYREALIPKARQAFEMYTGNFRQMSAPYPQLLASQRNYVQLQDEYLGALLGAWESSIEIDGLLAGDGMR